MRIEFYQPAGTYEVPGKGEFAERYDPHAFDGCIGKEIPFKIEGTERGRCTVVAVKVDEDGGGATWTVDIVGGHPDWRRQPGRWSIRLPGESYLPEQQMDPYPERRSPDYCWRSWPPRHTDECGCVRRAAAQVTEAGDG
jgi:hypothetical protein